MTRDRPFYWAAFLLGAAMVGAFVFVRQDLWLLVLGTVLALYGTAHGTLEKLTANKDGIVAEWQTRAIRDAMRAGTATDQLTIGDSAEASVNRGGQFTADAVLSPAEFREVLDAVSTQVHVVFDGGPNHGLEDWFPAGTTSVGANERVGDEVRAAQGAYLPTDERDPQGRLVFRWTPLVGSSEAQ